MICQEYYVRRRPTALPTLAQAAHTFTSTEIALAPELPTLAALDAALQAAKLILELQYPAPGDPSSLVRDDETTPEAALVDTIYTLSQALRSTLSAFYSLTRADDPLEAAPPSPEEDGIPF